jgi:pSer/pThr/pTyr-binding forkhead associated (FHA) protein
MDKSIDYKELTTKALAGALGGFIGWLPIEVAAQGLNFIEPHQPQGIHFAVGVYAGLVGGLVNAPFGRSAKTTFWQFMRTFLLCAFLLSLLAGVFATVLFDGLVFPQANADIDAYGAIPNFLLAVGDWYIRHGVSLLDIFLARVSAYAIFGAILGLSVGLTSFAPANLIKGAAGGGLGGFAGGLFWVLGGNGAIARMCSLTVTGLGIGLFIGVVNELTKVAWLTVEAGRLKGRQFRCDRRVINMGRAEENEVGLFGDPEVIARHACIERDGEQFLLKDLSRREGTSLNGRKIDRQALQNGDLIEIGSYRLRFHSRWRPGVNRTGEALNKDRDSATARGQRVAESAWLIGSQGRSIAIEAAASLRIGRDADNSLVVDDNTVSRYHAVIAPIGQGFQIKDLGSSNGTFVNGRRLGNASVMLADGDSVRFGGVDFQFARHLTSKQEEETKIPSHRLVFCTKCGSSMPLQATKCPNCSARRF